MRPLSRVVFASVVVATVIASARAQVPALEWRLASSHDLGPNRMVYDAARDRFVALATRPTGLELIEWDGSAWRRRSTATVPPWRADFGLAYDMGRSRVVMFGGRLQSGAQVAELWEYDGVDWTQPTPASGPVGRDSPAMTYDLLHASILMVGGSANLTTLRDAWTWDGVAWQRQPDGPTLTTVEMAFQLSTTQDVLVGHNGSAAEAWTFDGTTWTQVAAPPPATDYRMATDLAGNRIVLLPGDSTVVWQWNGAAWTQQVAPLDGRRACGLAANLQGQVLAFGGTRTVQSLFPISTPLTDTRLVDGIANPVLDDGGPLSVTEPQVAWDGLRSRLVCAGPRDQSSTFANVTWEHDGTRWFAAAAAPVPGAVNGSRMSFDLLRGRTVRFGGYRANPFGSTPLADLSEWDGTQWVALSATGPAARHSHAMTYDRVNSIVLLFGGAGSSSQVFGDTWQWNGTTWTQLATSGPPARSGPAMTHDLGLARTVLFGGQNSFAQPLGDTWQWNGTAWQQAATANSPPPRSFAMMDYDLSRLRTIMLSGTGASGQLNDVWEWDGLTWLQRPSTLPPLAQSATAAAIAVDHWVLVTPGATWIGATAPARALEQGVGCGGASLPVLRAFGDPVYASNGFAVELHRAGANAPFLIALGAGTANVPIGFGCTIYLPQIDDSRVAIAGPSGFARVPLPVPAVPQLFGLEISLQVGALDAQAPLGFGLSNAVVARIGR